MYDVDDENDKHNDNNLLFVIRESKLPVCCSSLEDITVLYERGILRQVPDGGYTIFASPKLEPFMLPKYLKKKSISKWKEEDKIWLNT